MRRYLFGIFIILLLFCTSCTNPPQTTSKPTVESPTLTEPQTKSQTNITPVPKASHAITLPSATKLDNKLKVHFIDVGQGDSILIEYQQKNILIDAGPEKSTTVLLDYLNKLAIKKLDIIIATHPHEDHIGGMSEVIRKFQVGKIYMPKVSHTTSTFTDLLLAISGKGLKISPAKAGVKFSLGDLQGLFVAPNSDYYEDLNDYSAVLKLTYSETAFLFEGDAEKLSEQEMLASGFDIQANVLKVAHHGSNSSSTRTFLKTVNPKYGVISVGKDNTYGHPTFNTLKSFATLGVDVFRTDELGTITIVSDGKSIWRE